MFGITGSDLVLPLFGLIIGGLTDYIALTLIFRPRHERLIAPGLRWQGLFHNRREQVTRDYGAYSQERFSPPPRLWTVCSRAPCRTSSSP